MLIYSKNPIKRDDLYSKCPSYIQSQELIANQAYYSMMLFKKNAMNLNAAEELREVACIYGDISSITDIYQILDKADINKLLAIVVGSEATEISLSKLRGDFHKRLKRAYRRKQ